MYQAAYSGREDFFFRPRLCVYSYASPKLGLTHDSGCHLKKAWHSLTNFYIERRAVFLFVNFCSFYFQVIIVIKMECAMASYFFAIGSKQSDWIKMWVAS